VVVREDLTPGEQMAQATHAAIEFCCNYYEKIIAWNEASKYLVVLSTSNEESLVALEQRARDREIDVSVFIEPDRNNEKTAIALEPGKNSSRLCSTLPLAFKRLRV
jgi:peptidyl-tRNA hydrolase